MARLGWAWYGQVRLGTVWQGKVLKSEEIKSVEEIDIREILLPLAIVCIFKITREEILKSDLESGAKKELLNLLGINTNKE